MRDMLKSHTSLRLCAALAAAGLAMAGGPVLAQTTVEEVIVTGRIGPDGEPRTLSRVVSYRDLDITTEAGQEVLENRIRATADDLCRLLDEQDVSSPILPSCQDAAVRDAMGQMNTHVAAAVPRGPDWMAPAPQVAVIPAPVAPAVTTYAAPASVTVTTTTNGPVPDTPENRARFGGPNSNAGQRTAPIGN